MPKGVFARVLRVELEPWLSEELYCPVHRYRRLWCDLDHGNGKPWAYRYWLERYLEKARE